MISMDKELYVSMHGNNDRIPTPEPVRKRGEPNTNVEAKYRSNLQAMYTPPNGTSRRALERSQSERDRGGKGPQRFDLPTSASSDENLHIIRSKVLLRWDIMICTAKLVMKWHAKSEVVVAAEPGVVSSSPSSATVSSSSFGGDTSVASERTTTTTAAHHHDSNNRKNRVELAGICFRFLVSVIFEGLERNTCCLPEETATTAATLPAATSSSSSSSSLRAYEHARWMDAVHLLLDGYKHHLYRNMNLQLDDSLPFLDEASRNDAKQLVEDGQLASDLLVLCVVMRVVAKHAPSLKPLSDSLEEQLTGVVLEAKCSLLGSVEEGSGGGGGGGGRMFRVSEELPSSSSLDGEGLLGGDREWDMAKHEETERDYSDVAVGHTTCLFYQGKITEMPPLFFSRALLKASVAASKPVPIIKNLLTRTDAWVRFIEDGDNNLTKLCEKFEAGPLFKKYNRGDVHEEAACKRYRVASHLIASYRILSYLIPDP